MASRVSLTLTLQNLLSFNGRTNLNNKPNPKPDPSPNFATAEGDATFSNYSEGTSSILTATQTDALVQGGVAAAIADAQASFDPTFSSLFTQAAVVGLSGQFEGTSNSEAKVLASFAVGRNENFSFDFSADLKLTAKEIENPDVEYNKAQSTTTFLVLDTTNPNKARVLDYFGIQGKLISSDEIGNLTFGRSRNVTINSRDKDSDIDGNNGTDFLNGSAVGTYERSFNRNTNLTIVKINTSSVELAGDTLIGNLGTDVIYGTIRKDNLTGTNGADKLYASLGDDKLSGNRGNDNLDAGQGNDSLNGGDGNDTLYGGKGNDTLYGGSGNDVLVGSDGNDTFTFKRSDTLLKKDFDVIQDFQVGIDKLELNGWGSRGNITDTNDGALLTFNSLSLGISLSVGNSLSLINNAQQSILFSNVSASELNSVI
ncbi:calcium-binding protein [Nostoc sp. ChiQUE01b]|uniref:calcium-binding protein n=1 Tax=Nostoc sp. ChiQUE01b TaxID=3075376 RepID=UPI002AD3D535|nr:calcium-binding protein [Nostoc sp. ChiQUE01b]MDZ8260544.1 calcium-binding protein [Nostoc sp. ChiQUE01b]